MMHNLFIPAIYNWANFASTWNTHTLHLAPDRYHTSSSQLSFLQAGCPCPTNSVKALKAITESEWQWHQLGHVQVCTTLQADNYASTPPLSFLQAGCPSCRPTISVKALKASTFGRRP